MKLFCSVSFVSYIDGIASDEMNFYKISLSVLQKIKEKNIKLLHL